MEQEDTQQKDVQQDDPLQQVLSRVTADGKDREFLVSASDKRGHSEVVNFRAQPTWKRMVEVIVASREFPYKTASDFLRHAVVTHVQHLHALRGLPEKTQGMLMQQLAMDEVLKDEMIRRSFDLSLTQLSEAVKERQEIGDDSGAKQLVETVYSLMEAIYNPEQKELCIKRVKKRFGHLLPTRPLHPLRDIVDDEEQD